MGKKKDTLDQYKRNTINIFFPNQIEPDPENKDEFISYWKLERERCSNGFYIGNNQVYISGWLYFHCVYWVIELDAEFINPITGEVTSSKIPGTPVFRDVEWIVSNDLLECARKKKVYTLIGSRGFGKSFMSSSFIGQSYTFVSNSECLITAGNHPDIAKLAEKINMGLSNTHPIFRKQRVKNNWKEEVRAGWIDRVTKLTKGSNSRIITRNYNDGNDTMATNGTRPLRQIIDEAGKLRGLIKCVLDSVPSWMNDFGLFSTPIITGTGGDMEVGEDLGIIFNNPGVYNVLEIEDEYEGKGKVGRFIPVTLARNEYKEDWTLYKYLKEKVKGYENLEYHSDLDIIIKVSNEERCLKEFVEPRRAKALKSTSTNEIIKEKAYYPLTSSECFLTISANDFPVEAAKEQLQWLKSNEYNPVRVELFRDLSNRLQFKYSNKLPVRDFPVKADSNKEGVIEIIEFPIATSTTWDYVAGIDPYKISESDYSDSLGSVYIFKRITTSMTEPYQYMPVAWYHGRPKDINDWNENVSMLLEFYNAMGMCENADYGFITYMIQKNRTLFIAEGQSFLKEISPNSKSKSNYGLPPTPAMINHWLGCAVKYTKEEVIKERDSLGNIISSKIGVSRLMDVMLLEEIAKFNKYVGNYDRVRSFSICVAYAMQLDALFPTLIKTPTQVKPKEKIIKSPFTSGISMFKKLKSPFGKGQ